VWPEHIRNLAKQRLEQFRSKLTDMNFCVNLNIRNQHQIENNLKQNINLVIAALDESLVNRQELQSQAKDYFDKIDQLRRIQVVDYCPEFANIHG
jgi:hypothetical protein